MSNTISTNSLYVWNDWDSQIPKPSDEGITTWIALNKSKDWFNHSINDTMSTQQALHIGDIITKMYNDLFDNNQLITVDECIHTIIDTEWKSRLITIALNKCLCCQRHQKHRPYWYAFPGCINEIMGQGEWINSGVSNILIKNGVKISNVENCRCNCRSMARLISINYL